MSLTDPFGLCPTRAEVYKNRALRWAHTALDFGGFFWDGFDVANVLLYHLEGRHTEAAITLLCLIPAMGNFLAVPARLTLKLGDNAGEALIKFGKKYLPNLMEKGSRFFNWAGGKVDDAWRWIQRKLGRAGTPNGVIFEGRIYRSVNSAYDPLEMSQYTINSNHRYTEKGIPGLYFSSGEKIVKAELENYDVFDFSDRIMYSYDVKLTNMLDMSNPSVREQLGVSLDSIVGESYDTTHAIGRYTYNNGYNGIIVPSARADGGVNIILFNTKEKK